MPQSRCNRVRLERRSKAGIFACENVRKAGPTGSFLDWRTPNRSACANVAIQIWSKELAPNLIVRSISWR